MTADRRREVPLTYVKYAPVVPPSAAAATDAACAKPFEALALDWKVDGSGTGVAVAGKTQKVLKAVTP